MSSGIVVGVSFGRKFLAGMTGKKSNGGFVLRPNMAHISPQVRG
jgi:hypothetical protein